MCNFLSAVTDFKDIWYFSGEQRKAGVKMPDGTKPNYDSKTSICAFYGLREDGVEKLEYNPFTGNLKFEYPYCIEYEKEVRALLDQVDFIELAGDVKGCRAFIAGLKDIPWLNPDGTLLEGGKIKLFSTRTAARDAARAADRDAASDEARTAAWAAFFNADLAATLASPRDAARAAAWDAARDAARDAALDDAWAAAFDAARDAARDAAWAADRDADMDAARDAAWCAALYAQIMYVCAGLPIKQKHIDYITQRMEVWRHGYGVLREVDGVLYCYEKAV